MFLIIFFIFYSQAQVALSILFYYWYPKKLTQRQTVTQLNLMEINFFCSLSHLLKDLKWKFLVISHTKQGIWKTKYCGHHAVIKAAMPQIQNDIKKCKILNFLVKMFPSVYKFTFFIIQFLSWDKLPNCGHKTGFVKGTKEQRLASVNSTALRDVKFLMLVSSTGPCFWPIPPSTTSSQLPQFNHLPGHTQNHTRVIKKRAFKKLFLLTWIIS